MKRVISFALSIFLLFGCVLPVLAADGVPAPVMDATKSVVRILSEYSRSSATGSGFVIKNEPGEVLIATNDHVVEGNPHTISVWVSEDRQVEAEIVFTTSERDLCVLRLKEAVDMMPLKLSKEEPQHGAAIYAVGFPGAGDILSDTAAHTSDSATITDGIISAIRTFTIEKGGRSVKLLQVNAAINSGNSGGPLFNTAGEVIGINTYKVNAESQGIFGSVAVSELWDLLNQYGIVIPEEEPETTGEPIQESTVPELNPVWLAGGAAVVVIVSLAVVITVRKKSKTKKGKDREVQKVALTKYMERYPQGLGIGGAVSLLLPAAIQLRNLHNDGKLHLQICPDNILVGAEGSFLRDAVSGESARFNSGFAAPEVYKSAGFGITSDIYSFAAVLYYVATGRIPSNSLQQELLEQDFALLTDEAFAGIIRGCMAFSSFNRTQSMQELIYSIAAFNVVSPISAVQQADAPAVEKTASTTEKASKSKGKSRKWISVTIVLALVCTAAFLMMQKQTPVSMEAETTLPVEATEAVVQLSPEALKYNKAVDLFKNGEYGKAAIAFAKLGDYQDAKEISFKIWNAIADRKVLDLGCAVFALKEDGTVFSGATSGAAIPNVDTWTDIVAIEGMSSWDYVAGLRADGTVLISDINKTWQIEQAGWTNIVAITVSGPYIFGLKYDGTVVSCKVARDWHDVKVQDETIYLEKVSSLKDVVRIDVGEEWFNQNDGPNRLGLWVWTADGAVLYDFEPYEDQSVVDIDNSDVGFAILRKNGTVCFHQQRRLDESGVNNVVKKLTEEVSTWTDIISINNNNTKITGIKADGTVVGYKADELNKISDVVDIQTHNFGTDILAACLKSDGTVQLVAPGHLGEHHAKKISAWENIRLPADQGALLAQIELVHITSEDNPAEISAEAKAYNKAVQLFKNKEYAKAAIALAKLGDFRDAKQISKQIWDAIAIRETLSAGGSHTVGIKNDGTVTACGNNNYGQCDVGDWTDIVAVSAGVDHTVGLRSDGTVVAAGMGGSDWINVSEWTDIVSVFTGYCLTVGIKSDGSIVTTATGNMLKEATYLSWTDVVALDFSYWWGSAGSVVALTSDGTSYSYSNIGTLCDIINIATESHLTAAVKSDGTVLTFKEDKRPWNQLNIDKVSDWNNIIAIDIGSDHILGLKSDGTAVACGDNSNKERNVEKWSDIVSISAGGDYSVGLKSDGTVVKAGISHNNLSAVSKWANIRLPADQDALLAQIKLDYIT